jgi:hypothetical protein
MSEQWPPVNNDWPYHQPAKGNTVKPVYKGHPWDPQKAAVAQSLRHSWSLFTVYYYKILENRGPSWPLQTGGRCSEVAVNTGLTVVTLHNQALYNGHF